MLQINHEYHNQNTLFHVATTGRTFNVHRPITMRNGFLLTIKKVWDSLIKFHSCCLSCQQTSLSSLKWIERGFCARSTKRRPIQKRWHHNQQINKYLWLIAICFRYLCNRGMCIAAVSLLPADRHRHAWNASLESFIETFEADVAWAHIVWCRSLKVILTVSNIILMKCMGFFLLISTMNSFLHSTRSVSNESVFIIESSDERLSRFPFQTWSVVRVNLFEWCMIIIVIVLFWSICN